VRGTPLARHFDELTVFRGRRGDGKQRRPEVSMAKTVCTVLGAGFLLVGIVGFFTTNFLGMHLTMPHNVIHLVSGAAALYFGLAGTLAAAWMFCIVFGGVYLALGVIGFLIGDGAERLWTLIPQTLMFGTMDHVVHILLGAIFLIGGFGTRGELRQTQA
jgi:hypothetical protein